MKIDLPAEVNAEIQTNLKAQDAAEIQAEIDSQRQVNFKSSMTVAAGFEPARYAEAVQLERASGVPAKVAYDNWDKVQQVKQEDKLAGLFATAPRTAGALSDPQNAIIAKGDEDNLQYMERAVERATFEQNVSFWDATFEKWSKRTDVSKDVGRQRQLDRITADFDRVEAGEEFSSPFANDYRAADPAARKVMRDNLSLQKNLSTEKARTASLGLSELPVDPGDVAFEQAEGVTGVASTIIEEPIWAARKIGESLPDMAQGLVLGMINPIFGGLSEGVTASNYKLTELLQERGIDSSDPVQMMRAMRDDELMGEANARAARYGAGIGIVSTLSFGLLGKVMAPTAIGGKALTAGQRELISAGVQMPVQGALEAAGEATGQLAERGRASDLDSKEIALEGFLGALMAVPEAGGFAGKRFMQHMAQARRTERAATLQTDLVGKSLESSTRKNDPATFDAIVSAQLAGKPNEWLEIPAAKLQELNQSGQVNVPELLEQINVDPNHYAAQVELGGTVRMKNSSYLAYLAEYDEQLSSSVRFSTNDMSLEEVQAIDKQMLADMEQVAQNFGKTDQVAAAYSDVMGQLLGAGYERSAADTTARQYSAVMTRLAEQTGQTVEDVMAANPLNIGRDLPPTVRRIKGDEISLMLGRLRAGDVPRPADMFGKSLTEYLTASGGLDDTGGELAAFDADVGKVGRNRLARAGGKSLDDAAMAAWERGYFPGMAREDVTPNMLIDALREEAAGTPRFSVEQENAALRDQAANLDALQAYLDEQGIDLETATDEEVLALLRPGQPTDTSLEQFAGPTAWSADVPALEEAQARIAAGDNSEQVRQATGWFIGVDGRWRFEIDDSDARFRGYDAETDTEEVTTTNPEAFMDWIEEATAREKGIPLSQALHHPALFAAYPELAGVRLKVDPTRTAGGYFASMPGRGLSGSIIVIGDPYGYSSEVVKPIDVLMHEVQHAIQMREGFAPGGSPDILRAEKDQAKADLKYWGSVSALRRQADAYDGDYARARQELEDIFEEEYTDQQVLEAQQAESAEALANRAEAAEQVMREIGNPVSTYNRLAGEIEARNTEARREMTAAERLVASPEQTADIPADRAVIRWNGTEMISPAVNAQAGGQTTLNQAANPELARAMAMSEDEYIAAVNPENKRSDEADIVIVRTGDLDMPRDARPAAGFKDKTGADVQVFVDGNGSIYAQQDGEVIGQIENRDGETLNIVTVEAQGKGIGQGLAAELIRRQPFAPAGSFSPAGEATRRAAFRQVKAEQRTTLNQSQLGAAQTETEAFKKWFGDSKVVDADGKPLVVYHGTDQSFDSFASEKLGAATGAQSAGQGFFFVARPDVAVSYANYAALDAPVRRELAMSDKAEAAGDWDAYDAAIASAEELESEIGQEARRGQNVIPVYLSIKNPAVMDAGGELFTSLQDEINAFIKKAKRAGNDGVIINNLDDDPRFSDRVGDHYITFKPEQIKSAVGNSGTFDPASANILEQAGEEDARGSITFGPRQDGVRRFDIKLGKKSDLSTVLHEMGHYYLEVIGDLVHGGKANETLAADYGVIRDWLGAEADKPLTVDQHEQFARGFEKYLATGKAPSIELQDAFARFKRWLVGVYKDLARLNVELSPQVRGVFDRLLASEQAITEAEQALALTEQYEARITELMNPDEKANYLRASRQAREDATSEIEQEILKAEKQKDQAWYKEQRRKVEKEVRDELEASQPYQARKYLFGNTPHPDIGRVLRLDTAAVTELFGTKSKEARFLGRARARENGVHPEIAASILGYPNPVEMLTDMRAVPSLAEAVKLETERRMAERYPDPRKDGTLADKAMAAVGEREAEVQAIQLRTLARQAGRAPSQHKIIKEAARRHIASLKLRDVIPHAFRRASEKAARAVEDALIKGDMPKAYEEKEKQLMNLHLFREAVKAQDLSIQKRAQAKAYTKAGAKRKRLQDASVENYELAYPDGRIEYAATKTAAKQAEAEGATVTPLFNFLEQVDAILTRYEFSIPRKIIRQQREALVTFLASMADQHIVVNPPEWILLDRSQRTNWSELTIDELVDAVDMIKQIDQMAKNKLQVLKAGKWEDFEPIRQAIVSTIELNASAARSSQFNKSFADDIRRWGREWLGLLPVDQIARELDGQDDLGAVQENITTPVQVAARQALIREKAEHQELADLIKQFYSDDQLKGMNDVSKRVAVAEINDSLTKMQMLMLMANLGNEGNRTALMSEQRGVWSAETIQAVMARLDSNDADFVEALWAWVDKFWGEVSENEAKRTGVAPAKVQNDPYPVKLADGKVRVLKGGYFPLKYDGDLSIKTSQDDVANAFKNMTAGRTSKAYTPEGHKITRVGSGGRPVKLDFSVVLGHVNEVVRDIVMTDPVNQSWRYLHDSEIQGAFEQSNLKEIFTALEIWLQDTAEGEKVDTGYMTSSARWLRVGFTANVMLFNLANSMLNLAGTHPIVVLGKRWALNGYRAATKPANWAQMYELSEYMREGRADSYSNDLQLVQDHMRGKGGWRDVMTTAGFYLHNKTQMFMDAVTWMGAYEKGMSLDLAGQELITYADQRVVEASGSGVFADRSAMARGTVNRQTRQNEIVRGLTTLAGYMIRKMAIARRRTGETNFKDIGQAANWAVDMALLFTVEGLMFAFVKGNTPDEDEEDQASAWVSSAAWETFASIGSGLPPFGRPVVSGLRGYGSGSTSIDIFAGQFGDAIGQVKQGDADVTAAKALTAMIGTATKTPGIATNRIIDWLDRSKDGETPPWYELLTGNRDK
jgi:hypothetical protein